MFHAAEIGAKVFAVLSKVARGVKALPDVKGYNVIQNNGKVRAGHCP
jgi:diadenosine tetraphosphate (Ap4A) HIT family hydrolase